MPKLKENQVPSYRLHKQSGQAIVTLTGRDHLLGTYGSAASKLAYKRLTSEWLAGGGAALGAAADLSVVELIRDFFAGAKVYYRRPDGTITSEVANFVAALRPLKELYGRTNARYFGPLALKAVRDDMIRRGWCRTNINRQINRVKHVFKWAEASQLLPASVYHALQTVPSLKQGRSEAREREAVTSASSQPDHRLAAIHPNYHSRYVAAGDSVRFICQSMAARGWRRGCSPRSRPSAATAGSKLASPRIAIESSRRGAIQSECRTAPCTLRY